MKKLLLVKGWIPSSTGLLIVLFFSLQNNVFAENILLITNPKSQETSVFRKGSYIVFGLKTDKSVREGFIRDITDSFIVFDNLQVPLSQVNIFAGSTKINAVASRVANAVGGTLLCSGTSIVDFGLDVIFFSDFCLWPIGGTISLAGAFIAGLGHMFNLAGSSPEHAVRVRNYKDWNASIVTLSPAPVVQSGRQPATLGNGIQQQIFLQKNSTQTAPAPENPKKEKRKKSKIYGDDVYGD